MSPLLLRRASVLAFTLSIGGLWAVGCSSSDDQAEPSGPPTFNTEGGSGGTSGGAGSAQAGAGTGGTAQGGAGTGGSSGAGQGGSSGAGAGGAGTCIQTPKTSSDYLNRCTDSSCAPYDNSKLSKYQDGKLPPLP